MIFAGAISWPAVATLMVARCSGASIRGWVQQIAAELHSAGRGDSDG